MSGTQCHEMSIPCTFPLTAPSLFGYYGAANGGRARIAPGTVLAGAGESTKWQQAGESISEA